MKLTKQILGAYIGAQVILVNSDRICVIEGLAFDSVCTGLSKAGVPMWWKMNNCRLLLTPLSKISDEDALEVVRIARPDLSDIVHLLDDIKGFFVDALDEHTNLDLSVPIIDYLRSPYRLDGVTPKPVYDLGHGEIKSLIAAGLAEDVTMLNI